jgi:hypothetical protein
MLLALDRRPGVAVAWMAKPSSPNLLALVVPGPAIEAFSCEIREAARSATRAGMLSTAYQRGFPSEFAYELSMGSIMRVDKLIQADPAQKILDCWIDDSESHKWSWSGELAGPDYRSVYVGQFVLGGQASIAWCFDQGTWGLVALIAPTRLLAYLGDQWTEACAQELAATGQPTPLRIRAPRSNLFEAPVGVFMRWMKNEPGPEGHPSLQSIAGDLSHPAGLG